MVRAAIGTGDRVVARAYLECETCLAHVIDNAHLPRVQPRTMSAKLSVKYVLIGVLSGLTALAGSGCNLNKIAADQTASLLTEAAPALDGFWDWEIAGIGTPGAIMQLEAMLAITPDNESLSLNVAKAYVGYGVGWVENDYEIAYAKGEFDKSDRLRHRARLLYLRARNLSLRCMRNRDAGIDDALKAGGDNLTSYLKKHYTDKGDVGPLFWAGMAWGAAINMGLDQPDLLADMSTAKALVQRAADLDDMFFTGGAYVFLGGFEAAMPKALGGDPEKGAKMFEKGLERTKRRNHMLQVNYARIYAVNAQNRDLYVKLLNEVIESGDLGNDVRLNNKIARIRAVRYLSQVNDLF